MEKIKDNCYGVPNFYGALVLYVPQTTPLKSISCILQEYKEVRSYDNILEIVYREVKGVRCWEVDYLLSTLFSICDLEVVSKAVDILKGQVLIDISFTHSEKYPVLIFEKINMDIIRMLHADISIDPY